MNSAYRLQWGGTALLVLLFSVPTRAEITLLKADPNRPDFFSRFNFRAGGDVRLNLYNVMGHKDSGSWQHRLFDGGSRFRFHLRFDLDDDLSLLAYSEVGVNTTAMLGWHGHHAPGARNTNNRQLFGGLRSKRWGELTYGHRHSIYYDVVTVKSDIWGNDMHTEPVSLGADGNYDGSFNALRSLNYVKHVGPVDVHASYLLAEHPLYQRGMKYKRHNGQSLGVNYHISPDLLWGFAWGTTRSSVITPQHQNKKFNQQLLGSGFSWTPGHWTVALTGGWYRHFVALTGRPLRRYFANRAWGLSYFIGHDFPVNRFALKSVMPIYFGAQLRAGDNHERYQRENGLGVEFFFYKGFRFDYQHVFRSSNDHMGDLNFIRFRYDF